MGRVHRGTLTPIRMLQKPLGLVHGGVQKPHALNPIRIRLHIQTPQARMPHLPNRIRAQLGDQPPPLRPCLPQALPREVAQLLEHDVSTLSEPHDYPSRRRRRNLPYVYKLGASGGSCVRLGSKVRELGANGHAVAREVVPGSVIPTPERADVCGWRAQAVVFETAGLCERRGLGRERGCSCLV